MIEQAFIDGHAASASREKSWIGGKGSGCGDGEGGCRDSAEPRRGPIREPRERITKLCLREADAEQLGTVAHARRRRHGSAADVERFGASARAAIARTIANQTELRTCPAPSLADVSAVSHVRRYGVQCQSNVMFPHFLSLFNSLATSAKYLHGRTVNAHRN